MYNRLTDSNSYDIYLEKNGELIWFKGGGENQHLALEASQLGPSLVNDSRNILAQVRT